METIALPTLSGVEHAYVDLPGLRMHVAEAGAEEPVLLLHGFPQHWWEWRGIIPRLAPHYRVICPDLRGAGWTDAPAEGYTSEQQRADVLALLDCLGLDRVRLVAHDWSAIVGFQLAIHHPERIEQYVSLATPHPWIRFRPAMLRGAWRLWFQPVIATPGVGPRLLARGDQRLARYLLEQDGAGGALRSAEDREAFLAPLRQPERARAGSAIYRGLILPELRRIVTGAYRESRLDVPTLVLYGTADPALVPNVHGGYEANADDLAVEPIEGASHFLADQRPDPVADRILAFFGAS
ncbi:MAG TPA: alpha/beta fold hydrolase [Propionibacteriaceae bacterium]